MGKSNDLGEMGAESCSFLVTSDPHLTKGLIQNPCHLAGPSLSQLLIPGFFLEHITLDMGSKALRCG
jgi:hypothetical protein